MKGRIRRAVLLSTLAVMLASPAFAAGWKHLGSDKQNTHYFYKPKTYSMKKNIAGSWTKKEYNVDVSVMAQKKIQPDDYAGTKSVVAYEEFNCTEKKKRTIIGKVYEGSEDHDVSRTGWGAVESGSIDAGLLAELCRNDRPKEGTRPSK